MEWLKVKIDFCGMIPLVLCEFNARAQSRFFRTYAVECPKPQDAKKIF